MDYRKTTHPGDVDNVARIYCSGKGYPWSLIPRVQSLLHSRSRDTCDLAPIGGSCSLNSKFNPLGNDYCIGCELKQNTQVEDDREIQ